MFKNLTYKQKNILLLIGAVLFAFVVYYGAIENTIEVFTKSTALEEKLVSIDDAPQQKAAIEKQQKELEQIFGREGQSTENYQEYILGEVSNFCTMNNVVLREFPKPFVFNEQDFIIETNRITVEGDFSKLLNLAYLIEQKRKLSRIASMHFQTFSRNSDGEKKTFLSSTIYLQHIKPNKND